MTETVLVYDNEEGVASKWVKKLDDSGNLPDGFIAEVMHSESLEALKVRYKTYEEGKFRTVDAINLDRAAILIIDYNLIGPEITSGDLIAYLARCFTDCGLIVGVNRNGENPFDLTLVGDIDSFCDLHIGIDQLTNRGLWSDKWELFRPWYWPQLPRYLDDFRARKAEISKEPDARIADTLGMEDAFRYLPRTTRGYLGEEPLSITFRQIVLESPLGFEEAERRRFNKTGIDNEAIARISAARVSKWVERLVLSGQEVLVDAPHLVSRFPSLLLNGDPLNIETWNNTARFEEPKNLGIDVKMIEKYRAERNHWISRPAWFWRDISIDPNINEVSVPWDRIKPNFLFCEDSSRFAKRKDARLFHSKVDSAYVRRYVAPRGFKGVKYKPYARLKHVDDSAAIDVEG